MNNLQYFHIRLAWEPWMKFVVILTKARNWTTMKIPADQSIHHSEIKLLVKASSLRYPRPDIWAKTKRHNELLQEKCKTLTELVNYTGCVLVSMFLFGEKTKTLPGPPNHEFYLCYVRQDIFWYDCGAIQARLIYAQFVCLSCRWQAAKQRWDTRRTSSKFFCCIFEQHQVAN